MTIYLISTLVKWMNLYIDQINICMIKFWLIVLISNKNDQMDKTEKRSSFYSKSNLIENHIIYIFRELQA